MYLVLIMATDILSYAAASQNAWSKNMHDEMGYETQTTFWQDFTIAECFGDDAIIDTFLRAFNEWKNNVVYLTELVMVLNHKISVWYDKDDNKARIYDSAWRRADIYACEHLQGEDAAYYYRTTD